MQPNQTDTQTVHQTEGGGAVASKDGLVGVGLDQAFSNGKWNVNVSTVGELIDELSRLPRTLAVKSGFADSADVVVFNRDSEPFLELQDGGDWADDED